MYTPLPRVWKRINKEARPGNCFGAKQKSKPCLYASYVSNVNWFIHLETFVAFSYEKAKRKGIIDKSLSVVRGKEYCTVLDYMQSNTMQCMGLQFCECLIEVNGFLACPLK